MVKTILIVDDDPGVTHTIKYGLESLNADYKVICVESGEKCLELLEKNQIPDLVILDIMMPGMDGWDVAARIKENSKWSEIPIVFLTAKGDEMSIGMGRLASEEYVVKPFDIIKLKERVEEILTTK